MKIHRSISEQTRTNLSWQERWQDIDHGLISCWELGREIGKKEPDLVTRALQGQLVPLPFKGGVEKKIKKTSKFGPLYYLATWQGLRGEDLDIDMEQEIDITCTRTDMTVTFTSDYRKYGEP